MIGIFDSGVGGLTVVKEIFKHLPKYQIIYFGDTARLPYGTKGAEFVQKYSAKISNWLLNKGAKLILLLVIHLRHGLQNLLKRNLKECLFLK